MHWLFFFFFFCAFCFLPFLLNIYYLYVHIQLHRFNKFLQYFHNYLTICIVNGPLFLLLFFFLFSTVCRFCLCSFCLFIGLFFFGRFCLCFFFFFLSFLLNIYYLYVHIQLHRLNKFLQYFDTLHRSWASFSFFHRMLVLLVLFLSFLLNIYMRIHNYTDTTPFYKIFTIIEVSIF